MSESPTNIDHFDKPCSRRFDVHSVLKTGLIYLRKEYHLELNLIIFFGQGTLNRPIFLFGLILKKNIKDLD